MKERQESVTLKDVIIIPDQVQKKLNKLNVSKSADIEGTVQRNKGTFANTIQ